MSIKWVDIELCQFSLRKMIILAMHDYIDQFSCQKKDAGRVYNVN